jgi:hypothetical protein
MGAGKVESLQPEIAVGAIGSELRYWRAKEAVRQAELRLSSQTDARRGFEARVTAMLGWIVAASSILTAGLLGSSHERAIAAMSALIPLLAGAGLCIAMIWPSWWSNAGYDPDKITESGLGTELEILESMAAGYAAGIAHNENWLRRASLLMSAVFCLTAGGALLGAAVLLALNGV